MNKFYFTFGSILFLMLFYFLRKRNSENKKVVQPTKNNKERFVRPKITAIKKVINLKNQKAVQLKMSAQNKWLYPNNQFGKMEKGVVNDSEF